MDKPTFINIVQQNLNKCEIVFSEFAKGKEGCTFKALNEHFIILPTLHYSINREYLGCELMIIASDGNSMKIGINLPPYVFGLALFQLANKAKRV